MSSAPLPASVDAREKILATGRRIMGGKGFSAVGLNEVLVAAGVPKGSFYHYFGSKEAFGEAMLEDYFSAYLGDMDLIFRQPGQSKAEQLVSYFQAWRASQASDDCQGRCLAVKLGAEVADLSESMRCALLRGTAGIIERLAAALEAGVAEGSLSLHGRPHAVAQGLYQLWLGASIMVKIVRTDRPFDEAQALTDQLIHRTAA